MKKKKANTLLPDDLFGSDLSKAIFSGAGEALMGAFAGTGLSAIAGKHSILAGTILSIAGSYYGGKLAFLKTVGASTIAYGVAKRSQYQSDQNSTVSKRLNAFGNDWFGNFKQQWKDESQKKEKKAPSPKPSEPMETIHRGNIEDLDVFKELNKTPKEKTPTKEKTKETPKVKEVEEKVEKTETKAKPVQKNTDDQIKRKFQQALLRMANEGEDLEVAVEKVGLDDLEAGEYLEAEAQRLGIDEEQVFYKIANDMGIYQEPYESESEPQLSRAERRKLERQQKSKSPRY